MNHRSKLICLILLWIICLFGFRHISYAQDIRDKFTFGAIATPYDPADYDVAHKFEVTKTSDDGTAGTLRWAITQVNASGASGQFLIYFNIPGIAPHNITIDPSFVTVLPAIQKSVIIDGLTQPNNGYSGNSPKIIISNPHFRFAGTSNNVIQGMQFQQLLYAEISAAPGSPLDDRWSPLYFDNSSNNQIVSNIFTKATSDTQLTSLENITLMGGTQNVIQGNIFGTDINYNTESYNQGIFAVNSSYNVIGGEDYLHGNVFSTCNEGLREAGGNLLTEVKSNMFYGNSNPIYTDIRIVNGSLSGQENSRSWYSRNLFQNNVVHPFSSLAGDIANNIRTSNGATNNYDPYLQVSQSESGRITGRVRSECSKSLYSCSTPDAFIIELFLMDENLNILDYLGTIKADDVITGWFHWDFGTVSLNAGQYVAATATPMGREYKTTMLNYDFCDPIQEFSITDITHATCGNATGSISFTVDFGSISSLTFAYSVYEKNGNRVAHGSRGSGTTVNNLKPGEYTLKLHHENDDCEAELVFVIQDNGGSPIIAPDISTTSPLNYCTSSEVDLNLSVSPNPDINGYQWFKDGSPISGQTSSTYNVVQEEGKYYVEVTNSSGCTFVSNEIKIDIIGNQQANAGVNGSTCNGEYIMAAGLANTSTGLWGVNSLPSGTASAIFVDPTSPTSKVILTEPGTYSLSWTVNGFCNVDVDYVTVTNDGYQLNIEQLNSCGSATLSANITPDNAGYTYQWYDQFCNEIPGATGPTFVTSDIGTYSVIASNGSCTVDGSITMTSLVSDANEYLALRDLYLATDGDNWSNNTGWDMTLDPLTVTSTDLESFYGVFLLNGDVHQITLDGNNLNGTLPNSIGNLCSITRLSLRNNHNLTGNLPAEIGNLINLEHLNLYSCDLNGQIPAEIGELSNLEYLGLNRNAFTGSIPVEIGDLANLEVLDLMVNSLTGQIPPELVGCQNLRVLHLKSNSLTGSVPAFLDNLQALTSINLASNQFAGSIPGALGNLPNLNNLDLSGNDLTGSIPVAMFQPELSYLRLQNNQLSGSIPANIAVLEEPIAIDFSGNELVGLIPSALSDFEGLNELKLNSNLFNFGDLEQFFSSPGVPGHTYLEFDYSPQNSRLGTNANNLVFDSENASISLNTPGTFNRYQWQKENGGPWINVGSPQNNSNYDISPASASDAGMYRSQVTNDWVTGLTLYSQEKYLHVLSGELEICSDGFATITMNGPGAANTQWYNAGGSLISTGATFQTSTAGNYQVEVTYNGVTSNRLNFTVGAPVSNAGPDQSICESTTPMSAGGSYVSGSWSIVNQPGGSNVTFTDVNSPTTEITLSDFGTYVLSWDVLGECGSDQDQVTINYEEYSMNVARTDVTCGQYQLTANILPSNAGFTYQWYQDGSPIPGATSVTYTATTIGNYTVEATRFQCTINAALSIDDLVSDSQEYLALKSLYENLDGANWTNNSGWDMTLDPVTVNSADFSGWFGITVTGGDVTEISFYNNNVSGDIPAAIQNLCQLQVLHFGRNQITSIPDEFGNLDNLISFTFRENQISSLPSSIGDLANLEGFNVGYNQLTELPPSIGDLTNLTLFAVNGNQLQSIPNSIENLTEMDYLALNDNQLQSVPAGIGNMSKLTKLYLSQNELTDIPGTFANLTLVERVWILENYFDFGDLEIWFEGPGDLIHSIVPSLYNDNPQYTVLGEATTLLSAEGSDITVPFTTPGVHNFYQWQKDNGGSWTNVGSQQTTAPYQITGSSTGDAGIYRAEVTNEWVTGLTLPSHEKYVHILSGINEICGGVATKTITGPGAINAVWYNASNAVVENGESFDITIPGDYSVEVTYDGVTSNRIDFTIYELVVNAGADQVICDPGTDIAATGNFVNGSWSVVSGPGSVTFSDETIASTSITLNQTDYGIYVLRFTGNGECEVTQDDVEINYDPNYAANINFTFSSGYEDNGTFYSCPGSSITIQGSMSPGNLNNWRYDWTRDGAAWLTTFGNSTSQVATSLTEDTDFGVTISRLGCSRDADVKTVNMNHFADAITITVEDNDPVFCPGDSRDLAVPAGYSGYQWRKEDSNNPGNFQAIPGGTGNVFTSFDTGRYEVEIIDNTGCHDFVAPVQLSFEEITSVTVDNTQPTTCDLTLDGLADFRIQWPSGIGSASYEVFTSGGLLVTSGTAINNELVTVTGLGRGTYRIVALHPGTQCPTTTSFTIQYGGPVANICATTVSCSAVYPDVSQTSDVSFTVSRLQPSPTGTFNYEIVGTNGYSYEGSGSFGTLVSGVPALTYDQEYTLLIKDEGDNTCGRSYPIEIENANIALSTDQTGNDIVVCEAGETVDVGINASLSRSTCGATPTDFFTINWTKDGVAQTPLTGQTSPVTLPTLGLGSYEVTVTSEETGYTDCTESLSFTITQSDLNATANTTDVSCPGGSNGRAWGLVTGGYPPYTYEWIEVGTGATVSNFAIAGGLPAGDYQLQVSDSRCTSPFTVDVTINEPDPIGTVAFTLPTVSSCVVESYITDPGGTAPYTFTWSRSVQTYVTSVLGDGTVETVPGAIVEEVMFTDPNLTIVAGEVRSTSSTTEVLPGTYIITVRDANGCEIQSAEQEIEQPPVVRDYKICFRWKTRAIEEPGIENPPIVFDNHGIASSAMGQSLTESAELCVEDAVAAFTGSFEQLCLSGDYLNDEVSLKYDINQYHYTLYYYDRAGNLNRTIPPKGVNFLTDASQTRDNTPAHTLVTEYDYNNWGQLTRQLSPDGGETHFAYNNQGQLRFSQNAKQLANNTFSYTKYDRLSRIVEVGQAEQGTVYTAPDANTYPNTTFADLQSEDLLDLDKQNMAQTEQFPTTDHNSAQQTKTFYTELSGEQYYGNQDQEFLRNRVSYSEITNKDGSVASSHYSYDPHGNVKWLIQNIPGVDRHYIGYDYDLINGNVKQVKLNEGSTAPYYHQYTYDEDNRIIQTETSNNPFIWETDAEYDYYAHGPLRRTELGEDKVQGLDYAYTIHGWLKGINHPSLTNMDIGGDSFNNQVAKDAFGMTLNYYEGDFQNNGSPFEPTNSYYLEAKTGGPDRNLYNGNISAWSSRVLNPSAGVMQYDQTIGWQYEYDELNRIKSSSFSSHDGTSWTASNDYGTDYTYDPNGNLMSLNRKAYGANDTERAMDELTYHYNPANNQLEYVDDAITSSSWLSDIEDQSAGNYTYDEIGNLINDVQEGTSIDWNVYGKVNQILHNNGDQVTFSYDAIGNRIRKTQVKGAETKETFYVRDATGNMMAIFEGDGTTQSVKEIPLYGSDRLGQYRPSIQIIESVDGTETLVAYTGVSYLVEESTDALILQPGFQTELGDNFYAGPDPNKVPPVDLNAVAPADATHVRLAGRKHYEMSDHLGNVRAVVTDRKLADFNAGTGAFTNILPELAHASNYFAFGMDMPGMNLNSNAYRYGFQGQEEEENEEFGQGKRVNYRFRIHDPRIGRFLSVDPLEPDYPWNSPYAFSENRVLDGVELEGLEVELLNGQSGPFTLEHAEQQNIIQYNNGYRTPDGKFASPTGSLAAPGVEAEELVWKAIEQKEGWKVTRGRVYVTDATGQTRIYDGTAQSPSGENIGLEIKSGDAVKTKPQREFDTRLNSSRENVATGTGKHKGLKVSRSVEIRVEAEAISSSTHSKSFVGSGSTAKNSFWKGVTARGVFRFGLRVIGEGLFIEGVITGVAINTDMHNLERLEELQKNNPYRGFVIEGMHYIRINNKKWRENKQKRDSLQRKNPYRGFVLY